MDAETLAYAAGLLDAEGCISLAKINPTKGNRRVTPGYELSVLVSSTDRAIVEWLGVTFGGNITDHSHDLSRQVTGWKAAATWRVSGRQAREFLLLLLPYLKIKQVIALLAIEFQDYKMAHSLRFKDYQREQEILEQQEAYYQHLNSLHYTRKVWARDATLDERAKAQNVLNAVPSPLTPIVIAYAAGLFDGEGCIRISVRRPDGTLGKGHLRQAAYSLRVKVANTDRSIIEWLQGTFPGYMQESSSEAHRAITGFSPAWEWGLSSQKAQAFLSLIVPLLRTKHDQAVIALGFQDFYTQHARYVQGTRPQEVVDRLEQYRQQVNGMNAKPARASPLDA